MTIRKATVKDLKSIKELYWELDSVAINLKPEDFKHKERSDEHLIEIINSDKSDFLVAMISKKVAGFSLIYERELDSDKNPHKYAYIQDFVVKKEYRRRGVGARLMDVSKVWAKNRNALELRLSIMPENENARRFYTKHGLIMQTVIMECNL
ncbi:MAG: GNAT family N-acetyltransferase [Oscillospiraceae bacterium]|nr:GNAT family N-acetyltransferase [Oscillospiraceae bacterium]